MRPKPRSVCHGHAGLPEDIRLRRLNAGDCLDQLTGLLHRAFSRLGAMGIPCSCVDQSAEVTRRRVARGDCFVALSGERIVGTITLYAPDAVSDSRHYRDVRVASARQLGVDPQFQGTGVGSALLDLACRWAHDHGYEQLALDTPEPAGHLIDYYDRLGFRVVETLQFSGRPYRSMVFAKSGIANTASYQRPLCPLVRRHAMAAPRLNRHIQAAAGLVRRTHAIRHTGRAQHSHKMAIGADPPRKRT